MLLVLQKMQKHTASQKFGQTFPHIFLQLLQLSPMQIDIEDIKYLSNIFDNNAAKKNTFSISRYAFYVKGGHNRIILKSLLSHVVCLETDLYLPAVGVY